MTLLVALLLRATTMREKPARWSVAGGRSLKNGPAIKLKNLCDFPESHQMEKREKINRTKSEDIFWVFFCAGKFLCCQTEPKDFMNLVE
jgi:hypothetical protein